MDLARQGALDGVPEWTVFGTDHQTHGRGRFADRRWITPRGSALTFTLLLRPPFPAFPLSLRSALGVARWVEDLGLSARIKWPNDVLIGGRKLSGILIESTQNYAGIGIGINIAQAPGSEELRTPATCLADHLKSVKPPRDYLIPLLHWLKYSLSTEHAQAEIEKRLAWLGEEVEIIDGQSEIYRAVLLQGLGPEGSLLYEEGGQIRTLTSGEVRKPT